MLRITCQPLVDKCLMMFKKVSGLVNRLVNDERRSRILHIGTSLSNSRTTPAAVLETIPPLLLDGRATIPECCGIMSQLWRPMAGCSLGQGCTMVHYGALDSSPCTRSFFNLAWTSQPLESHWLGCGFCILTALTGDTHIDTVSPMV